MTLEELEWDRHSDPPHDCDETCSGCLPCYVACGATVCDQTCPHAAAMKREEERWPRKQP